VLSDLFLYIGWGLISPIFSIFTIENIAGATIVTAGTSSAIYWFSRSGIQIPVARFLDKRKGERDDFHALVFALLMIAMASFMLAGTKTIPQLYTVQFFHGLALGIYQVAWPSIFSRHMDKDKVSLDWSLDRASIGAAVAVASILGSQAVALWGFSLVFMFTGTMSILSALALIGLPDLLFPGEATKKDIISARSHHKHKAKGTPSV